MAVTWTDTATRSRAQLTRDLARTNPSAARKQSMAIRKLAKTLDGTATYQRLPNGARFVPVPRYPVVVLYDRDPAEIGTDTFSSPQYHDYPDLQQIAKRMMNESSGSGEYNFKAEGGTTPVKKAVSWTSAGLHGTEWRIVAVETVKPA